MYAQSHVRIIPCMHNPTHWESSQGLCVSGLFINGGKAKLSSSLYRAEPSQGQPILGADWVGHYLARDNSKNQGTIQAA